MENYLKYLLRIKRTSDKSIKELHQMLVSRTVAAEYGVTKEQMKMLDEIMEVSQDEI